MLADKFWINPKGQILWVIDNYDGAIAKNLDFFNLNDSNSSSLYAHRLGFVEGEVLDEVLILRSSNIKYLYECLNKIKDHIDDITQIEFHLLIDGKIMIRNLNGKREIELFLRERIFPRNGKYKVFTKIEKNSLIKNIGSIINNLYAKKTKTNIITK